MTSHTRYGGVGSTPGLRSLTARVNKFPPRLALSARGWPRVGGGRRVAFGVRMVFFGAARPG